VTPQFKEPPVYDVDPNRPMEIIHTRGGSVELIQRYLALFQKHLLNPDALDKAVKSNFKELDQARLMDIFRDFHAEGYTIKGVKDGNIIFGTPTTPGIRIGNPKSASRYCTPDENRAWNKKVLDMLRSQKGGWGQVPYNKNEQLSRTDKPAREVVAEAAGDSDLPW